MFDPLKKIAQSNQATADYVIGNIQRFAFLAEKFRGKSLSWLKKCAATDLVRLGLSPSQAVPLSEIIRRRVREYGVFWTSGVLCDSNDKTVYTAFEKQSKNLYALKATHAVGFETLQEIRILHQLAYCDCVPTLIKHGWQGSQYYIVTWPVGVTLEAYSRSRSLTSSEIMHIGLQLWQCLCTIHDAGVFHRDIKPQNIILVDNRVQLIDFGGAESAIYPHECVVSTHRYRQSNWKTLSRVENDLYGLIYSLYAIEIGIDTWERDPYSDTPDVCNIADGVARRLFDFIFAFQSIRPKIVRLTMKPATWVCV